MSEDKKLVEVVLESGTFYTERVVSKYENRGGWQPSNPKHVTAFIPGTILDIKVNEGDAVNVGDTLMLFGAMKMDNVIVAPVAGKVKAINVKVGDSVPKGNVMIEIE